MIFMSERETLNTSNIVISKAPVSLAAIPTLISKNAINARKLGSINILNNKRVIQTNNSFLFKKILLTCYLITGLLTLRFKSTALGSTTFPLILSITTLF